MLDNKYDLLQVIGQGGSSIVYRATDHDNNEFAVKVIDPSKDFGPAFAASIVGREFNNLKQVEGHPNVLQAYDYNIAVQTDMSEEKYIMYQALEFAQNGSLSSFVRYGPLPEEICRFFMTQILHAVKHMHDRNYAHMDLKLNNILLDEFYNIKVADLGSSHCTDKYGGFIYTRRGTPGYMAPEVKNAEEGEGYPAKNADVYSLGVCLHVMATGKFPDASSGLNFEQRFETASSADSNSSPNIGNSSQLKTQGLSEDLKYLLEEMLNDDEVCRITVDQVFEIESGWLSKPFSPTICEEVYYFMEERKSMMAETSTLI